MTVLAIVFLVEFVAAIVATFGVADTAKRIWWRNQ